MFLFAYVNKAVSCRRKEFSSGELLFPLLLDFLSLDVVQKNVICIEHRCKTGLVLTWFGDEGVLTKNNNIYLKHSWRDAMIFWWRFTSLIRSQRPLKINTSWPYLSDLEDATLKIKFRFWQRERGRKHRRSSVYVSQTDYLVIEWFFFSALPSICKLRVFVLEL